MKLTHASANNHKKAFELRTRTREFVLPYAVCELVPNRENGVTHVFVDGEIGREGFTYVLASGEENTIHIDAVLEYNRDPEYMSNILLYQLTVEAQKRIEISTLSTREIVRRLGTSAAQYYRLLDQTNYRKSIKQLLALLSVLDCDVELVIKDRVKKVS